MVLAHLSSGQGKVVAHLRPGLGTVVAHLRAGLGTWPIDPSRDWVSTLDQPGQSLMPSFLKESI
jgi:hypothetical protein